MPSTIPLVDTNILSELVRPAPDARVVAWIESCPLIAISTVTVEEIYFGLAWRPKERIRSWFEWFLESYCEVLPVTLEIARRAGELRGEMQQRGAVRDQADMLIAATAQVQNLVLATRNVRHFEGCGIPLLDPFDQPR
jgi:predicted nucleic acid-binding protein